MSSAVDILGREIIVGDILAKGMRSGNGGALAVGRVVEVVDARIVKVAVLKRTNYSWGDGSRPSRWPVDTVVIMREPEAS